jgi:hypothetical protein
VRGPWTGIGLACLAWLAVTGALGPCAFFRPAAPERPQKTAIIPDYSIPTRVLETIARGIADKNGTNGQDVYTGAFADSLPTGTDGRAYHAFFDLADLDAHPSWDRNRDWTRDLERTFYGDFIQLRSAPYEMTWQVYAPAGNDKGGERDSLLSREYRVYQIISGTRRIIAIGVADLYFVKSAVTTNRWVITRWQDFRAPDARADSPDDQTLGARRLFNK